MFAVDREKGHSTSSIQNPQASLISHNSPFSMEGKEISLSDILLTIAEQIKVIVLTTFISVFLTFTHVKIIQQPIYESSSTLLLSSNKVSLDGLRGLGSQFGLNLPTDVSTDLSSPSLFPEIINSYTFAERIMDKPFFTEQFNKELPLLAIFTYGDGLPGHSRDTLIQEAMESFEGMVSFKNKGSFSVLNVTAPEPHFAKELNKVVLDELQELNRYFKSQHVNEKIGFIESRIKSVKDDLEGSEYRLKSFREQNRQTSSPALQLEEERLVRNVEIQKGIFITLKQQFELAKIEEVQEASIVQVLDYPQVPLKPNDKNLKFSVLLAGFLGISLGIMLGFIRSYSNNSDKDERKKLRRVKYFFWKKAKDIIADRRISGIVSLLLFIGLPFYLGHKSKTPDFFGLYSTKLMIFNIIYILIFICFTILFFYRTQKK